LQIAENGAVVPVEITSNAEHQTDRRVREEPVAAAKFDFRGAVPVRRVNPEDGRIVERPAPPRPAASTTPRSRKRRSRSAVEADMADPMKIRAGLKGDLVTCACR
jgi:hypothetical protein